MRVIPLVIDEKKLEEAEKAAGKEPLLKVTPWKLKTAGVITTGSEVYKGLIKDQFTPVVEKKLEAFGIQMIKHVLCSDDMEMITQAIADMKKSGVDLIICTGGMSVDRMIRRRGDQSFRSRDCNLWSTDTSWGNVVSWIF